MNSFARTYHDLQKTRVSSGLRMQKIIENELEANGLMDVTLEYRPDGSIKRRMVKLKKDVDLNVVEQVTKVVEDLKEYQMIAASEVRFKKMELEMLKDAEEVYQKTELWDWCRDTKGLGPVSAMIFLGYINTEKATHAGKVFAYIGAMPGAKRKKGRKGNFDEEIKSKFWYTAENTIRHKDPYYYNIYSVKKEFYRNRPDLLYLMAHGGGKNEGFAARKWWDQPNQDWNFLKSLDLLKSGYLYKSGDGGKMEGWDGWMNLMAVRYVMKILISHALEIMRRSDGYQVTPVEQFHRNPLPIKPKDPSRIPVLLERFTRECARELERDKFMWIDAITDSLSTGALPKETEWEFNVPPPPPKKKKDDEDGDEKGDETSNEGAPPS